MPSQENVDALAKIKEDLTDITAMWIVDYRGLTVKEIQELRRNIRQAEAKMVVYKNTLVKIASKELEFPELDEALVGPSAFVVCHSDPVSSAKVIKDFAKDNENLVIKGGVMDGQFVDEEGVKAIASLPSREQIYAMFAGAISGIARGLAVTVNGTAQGIAQTVSQIAEQKEAA